MSREEFTKLTEELKVLLTELQEEIELAASFKYGYKAAGKRARKLARRLKNMELQKWINASVQAGSLPVDD